MGIFGFGSKTAVAEKPVTGPDATNKTAEAETKQTSTTVNAEAERMRAEAAALNAKLGTPLEPVKLADKNIDFEILNKGSVANLSEEEQYIFNRYAGDSTTNFAMKSKDGETVVTLCDGKTSYKQQFNNGTLNWMFGWLSGKQNRYGLNWVKTKQEESEAKNPSAFNLEPPKHIANSLKAGDYRALSIFKKVDGKFQKEPEVIMIIDSLGKFPEEVTNNTDLKPFAEKAEKAIKGLQQTYLMDQVIANPNGNTAKNPALLTSILHQGTEAFFKAEREQNKDDLSKAANTVFIPGNLRQARFAESNDIGYATLDWKHPVQKKDGSFASLSEVEPNAINQMTIARSGKLGPINPEFAFPVAWAQLAEGNSFPTDKEVIANYAIGLPEKNAESIAKFNAQLTPKTVVEGKPAPVPTT